jgi:hypothetical protein
MIRKAMGATLAAVTLAGTMATFSTEASAQYHRRHHHNNGGAVAAGVVGGLALGALAAGAANGGYGYGPGYGAPVYGSGYGGCDVHFRRVWDGYRWVRERVRECY